MASVAYAVLEAAVNSVFVIPKMAQNLDLLKGFVSMLSQNIAGEGATS